MNLSLNKTNDPIVERKTCRISGAKFPIYQSDLDFMIKFHQPSLERDFRSQHQRCVLRRDRERDYSGEMKGSYTKEYVTQQVNILFLCIALMQYILSMIRISDDLISGDPMEYGREFDFSKTFTEQFNELMVIVPRISSRVQSSENCEYTNFMRNGKDNYLAFASSESREVLYSVRTTRSEGSVDCLYCNNIRHSYWSFQCHNSGKTVGLSVL